MPHTRALRLADRFRRRQLPSLLRKMLVWKGLEAALRDDLIDDLEQELWLDCLQHGERLLALSPQERHGRWYRLLERCIYRFHVRASRQVIDACEVELVGGQGSSPSRAAIDPVAAYGSDLPRTQRTFLRSLQSAASYLKNGRLNCRQSARSLGIREHELRHAWDDTAAGLGWDAESLRFWRHRLVEALVGLAADLLRTRGKVNVHGELQRRRPDPEDRLRRIRRLYGRLSHRPLPRELKQVITRYRRGPIDADPRRILRDAAILRPDDPTVHLWAFEASIAADDAAGAAQAIRAARRMHADPVRVLLARARLQEFRGREAAARRLLERFRRVDARVALALRNLAS